MEIASRARRAEDRNPPDVYEVEGAGGARERQ